MTLCLILLFINESHDLGAVSGPIKEHAIRRKSVTAGSPRLLIVAQEILGDVEVDDIANVRLVDPHAERYGRTDNFDVVPDKLFLVFRANIRLESGMVGECTVLLQQKKVGDLF